jgi:hypothetical protein
LSIVSAVSGTKKCQDAEAKGVTVVDEDWVRNRINGGGGGGGGKKAKAAVAAPSVAPPAKKAKTTTTEAGEGDGDGGDSLSGLVFAITGDVVVFLS